MEIYFTFSSTHTVIVAEKALLAGGFLVKVRPIPNSIKAGCGLTLCLPLDSLTNAKYVLSQNGITYSEIYTYKDKQFSIIE